MGSTATVVHPGAVVSRDAELGVCVTIEPYAVIGPGVTVGDRTWVGHHAVIDKNTTIGSECRVFFSAVVGADPQDLKYTGEETRLEIGDRTSIREFAAIHRGTVASGVTRIGSDTLLMAYVHVAHDCVIGDRVIMANAVQLGGHVEIGDWAVIGGLTPIHQFCRIGAHAMVGGATKVSQDIAPFMTAAGDPPRLVAINSIGLRRRGFSSQILKHLKRAHKLISRSNLNTKQAMKAIEEQLPSSPELELLLAFLRTGGRGFVK